jgi:hypothetical protein
MRTPRPRGTCARAPSAGCAGCGSRRLLRRFLHPRGTRAPPARGRARAYRTIAGWSDMGPRGVPGNARRRRQGLLGPHPGRNSGRLGAAGYGTMGPGGPRRECRELPHQFNLEGGGLLREGVGARRPGARWGRGWARGGVQRRRPPSRPRGACRQAGDGSWGSLWFGGARLRDRDRERAGPEPRIRLGGSLGGQAGAAAAARAAQAPVARC